MSEIVELNGKSAAAEPAVVQRPEGRRYCDTCKFSQLALSNQQPQMWCRRSPPQAIGNAFPVGNGSLTAWSNTVWPVVQKDDWCGYHEQDPRGARTVVPANDSAIARA